MASAPTLVETEKVYSSKFTTLLKDKIAYLGNGGSFHETYRETVVRPDAVVVVAEDQEGVYFVKQYRWPAREFMLELPAGKVEEDMSPLETAHKELQEEIGYDASRMFFLGEFYASPGYSTEKIHAYHATGLIRSKLAGDDDEQIEIVKMSLVEALNAVKAGKVHDSKSMATLMLMMQKDFYGA